jgi:hypothetical protein
VVLRVNAAGLALELRNASVTWKRQAGDGWWPFKLQLAVDGAMVTVNRSEAAAFAAATAATAATAVASAPMSMRAGDEMDTAELGGALQKIQEVLLYFELTVKRLEAKIIFAPYSLVVTLSKGFTLGPGKAGSREEEEQEKFKSVIKSRVGKDVFSPVKQQPKQKGGGRSARRTQHPVPGSGGDGTGGARRGRVGGVEHTPVYVEFNSIDVTLMQTLPIDGDGGGEPPLTVVFGGLTFTVGLSIGLDLPDKLQVDLFPTHLKVELSQLPEFNSVIEAWHSGDVTAGAGLETAADGGGGGMFAADLVGLFALPLRSSIVCSGAVVELVDRAAGETAIVVVETCMVEFRRPTLPSQGSTETNSVLTTRGSVRGFTVSCMHHVDNSSSFHQTKNVSIKSIGAEVGGVLAHTYPPTRLPPMLPPPYPVDIDNSAEVGGVGLGRRRILTQTLVGRVSLQP